jgi:prepilin-type processing-associated H-X9-DG protein
MKRFCLFGCGTLFFLLICLLLFPLFTRPHISGPASCQSNLKQIALGIFMYTQDYDNKFPLAIVPDKTVGWANGLQPYLESTQIFHCPEEEYAQQNILIVDMIKQFFGGSSAADKKVIPAPDKPGFTDYWLNHNLSGLYWNKLGTVYFANEQIIMLGDGDGSSPQSTASYSIDQLPESWKTSTYSPAKRHLDGANYAFVDGHVKWLKPEQVSQLSPSKKNPVYTFSIQ